MASPDAVPVVFVHGAGGAGVDAWPLQAPAPEAGWHFLPRHPEGDDPARDSHRLVDLLASSGGGHVVAHSYGANAALLAAQARPDLVRSLALLEPACFDLARGMPAVEEHIAAMGAVFASASDPGLSDPDWFARFAAGMGFPPPASWDDALSANAARLRRLAPPWGVGLDPALPARTLVLTAPSSPLYAETAESLVGFGATHHTVAGAGHRVQDDPRVMDLLRDFWRS